MIVIRPTASLAKRMKVKLPSNAGRSSAKLGDWYAMDIVIGRQQFILCTSENARLPVVIPAAPYTTFHNRLPMAAGLVLRAIGVSESDISQELSEMKFVAFAKTANRSLLGSMNDFRNMLEAAYEYDRLSSMDPKEMSLYLAETISLVLPEKMPKDAAAKVFGIEAKSFPLSSYNKEAIERLNSH